MFDAIYWAPPLPVPQVPRLIHPTVYGGAADADVFWIEGEDLWNESCRHPIDGSLAIPQNRPYRIPSSCIKQSSILNARLGRQPRVRLVEF